MIRRSAARAVFAAVFCLAVVARANPRRVALLRADPELLRAVSLSLSAWDVETLHSLNPAPEATHQGLAAAARRLATQLGVEALVWTTSRSQPMLWVFEADTGELTTRVLTRPPPFDSVAAASVALTIKTVLRASGLAPAKERVAPPLPPPRRVRSAALQVGAGGYWMGDEHLDPRGQVAGMLWLAARKQLGLSLELSLGNGLTVESAEFRGRYRELAVGAKARFRLFDLPRFFTVVGVGGTARWAHFSGTLLDESRAASVSRVNGSVDVETAFNFRLTSLVYFGVSLGAVYFPTYQRYWAHGTSVFAPWPLNANLIGHCGVELF